MTHEDRHPNPDTVATDSEPEATPELEGISPLNPRTYPRGDDDERTFAESPEFHDRPDPGPNVGRANKRQPT
jgi:hypothetical protein